MLLTDAKVHMVFGTLVEIIFSAGSHTEDTPISWK